MLCRSAPEAKRTVSPRRSALDPHAANRTGHSRIHERVWSTANSSEAWLRVARLVHRVAAAAGAAMGRVPGVTYISPMLWAVGRRALTGLAVIIGVVTLMFFLIRLAPGDPALLLVGPTATQEQLAAQRKALGLDRPVAEQYATWLGRFARGDWGTSIATGRPVGAMLAQAWPATVRLVGISLVLSYLIGILVGVVQAARGGRL